MGCCMSQEERDEMRVNSEIEKELRRDRVALKHEVKLLLLGAGESGKSTVLKQMKLIHDGGISDEERAAFREVIFSNTVQSMHAILEAMKTLRIPLESERNVSHARVIARLPSQIDCESFSPPVVDALLALWADEGVRTCFARSSEFQLNDSANYFFDSVERISQHDYIPTDQDVLRSRVKTTGITETTFHVDNLVYRLFDVGGQRSERKKWIHCFDSVTAIIFLVAISEYDQVLFEDENVNRMQEALTLFDSICNSRWFVNTSIILFLNKVDVFKKKLLVSPLSKLFPDYLGDDSFESAGDYILHRFVDQSRSDTKHIYTHFTCATDTSQIKFVMAAVNDIIVHDHLHQAGLF